MGSAQRSELFTGHWSMGSGSAFLTLNFRVQTLESKEPFGMFTSAL